MLIKVHCGRQTHAKCQALAVVFLRSVLLSVVVYWHVQLARPNVCTDLCGNTSQSVRQAQRTRQELATMT